MREELVRIAKAFALERSGIAKQENEKARQGRADDSAFLNEQTEVVIEVQEHFEDMKLVLLDHAQIEAKTNELNVTTLAADGLIFMWPSSKRVLFSGVVEDAPTKPFDGYMVRVTLGRVDRQITIQVISGFDSNVWKTRETTRFHLKENLRSCFEELGKLANGIDPYQGEDGNL